jgi:hypothetical protein
MKKWKYLWVMIFIVFLSFVDIVNMYDPLKYGKKKLAVKTFKNGYRGVFSQEDIKV